LQWHILFEAGIQSTIVRSQKQLGIKQDSEIFSFRRRPSKGVIKLQISVFCSQAYGGMVMAKKVLCLISALLLSLPAFAQGRGGSQGRQQGRRQNQETVQAGAGQRDRDQTRLTTQQRDQLRTCDRLADGIRKQARTMGKSAGSNAPAGQLSGQRDQIRNKIREMEQEHNRLINGIDPTQQQRWQERIRNMTQLQQQLQAGLKQLDEDVDSGTPDPKRINERTREIEQTMKQWQKHYGALSSGF
jgi:hypothetical protein